MNKPTAPDPYRFSLAKLQMGRRVFISSQAHVSGSVVLGDDVSVWPMAVIRGDVNRIAIGRRSNIQDNAVLHVTHAGPFSPAGGALTLGDDITVGHGAILHACTIGHRCLIGMGAIVLDGAVVQSDAMVAAGAVITPRTIVPSGTLWQGNPARLARPLKDEELALLAYSARHYVQLKERCLQRCASDSAPQPSAGGAV